MPGGGEPSWAHPATPREILERAQWSERERDFTLAHREAFASALR